MDSIIVKLSPEQELVVKSRQRFIQVIACAGSGKTEAISRRVASLIKDGVSPESIIAFTFTDKAAFELKQRIYRRVEELMGKDFMGRLGPMFVGTIHAYCLQLLQNNIPEYGNYDILDEHRHAGLLSREYSSLGLNQLGPRHWEPIHDFIRSVDAVYNELIPIESLRESEFGEILSRYEAILKRYRFLTFGQVIAKSVEVLSDQMTFKRIHSKLKHLIVDEYQDINPAQERLIEILSTSPVSLCVVGDDDQSIYQWRGADLSNMLQFPNRYSDTLSIKLEVNRRSRPEIVRVSNIFAQTIPSRLDKAMIPQRMEIDIQVHPFLANNPDQESEIIADGIQQLHTKGWNYRDIAVLYRSVRTSAPSIIQQLDIRQIPFQCGGRTGLFVQPEINILGEIYAWFVDGEWRDQRFEQKRNADINNIVRVLNHFWRGPGDNIPELQEYLNDWKSFRLKSNRPVSLVGDFYRLLDYLGVSKIDPQTITGSSRLGAFARFSTVLADYENITRRGRIVTKENGRVNYEAGKDKGKEFFRRLHNYLLHYARDAYEDFDGEQIQDIDAVNILTVHQAKGLEWPIVFMPALSGRRFPSSKSGKPQKWFVPENVFTSAARERYEGSDSEERRLFYVAMTRARDVLFLSTFEYLAKKSPVSQYLSEVASRYGGLHHVNELLIPDLSPDKKELRIPDLELGFSDISMFEDCGYRYRLSKMLGFENEIAIELGYGRALHHILQRIAEVARTENKIPTWDDIQTLLNDDFYLPFADEATYQRMRQSAQWLIKKYTTSFKEDLFRIWATERPFEIVLDKGTVAGRADVILDMEENMPGKLAIIDYKSANEPRRDELFALQLAVYTFAGRGEGLDVIAAYLHNIRANERISIDISHEKVGNAIKRINGSIENIRIGFFSPTPEIEKCNKCDYLSICRFRKKS